MMCFHILDKLILGSQLLEASARAGYKEKSVCHLHWLGGEGGCASQFPGIDRHKISTIPPGSNCLLTFQENKPVELSVI